jgi:hypothetical protein
MSRRDLHGSGNTGRHRERKTRLLDAARHQPDRFSGPEPAVVCHLMTSEQLIEKVNELSEPLRFGI